MARGSKEERNEQVKAAAAGVGANLHIMELFIENIKRVKIARIKPKGNMVIVAGKNGEGKSSVLDAIDWALTGVSSVPSFPIRKGQRTATVRVNLGDFLVTRHFTIIDPEKSAKGNTYLSKLVITGKRGETYSNPQILLNELLGKISFDPLQFIRMKEDAQLETMRGLVTFDIDIDALDAAQAADYDERRIAGRGVDSAKAQLAAMNAPAPELPSTPIDTAAITAKLQNAANHNQAVDAAKRDREEMLQKHDRYLREAAEHRQQAQALLREADSLDGAVTRIEVTPHQEGHELGLVQAAAKRIEAIQIPEPIDTAEVAAELTRAQETNAAIQRAGRYRDTEDLLEKAEALWTEIDTRMATRKEERAAAIARAKMPIEGLSIGSGEVLYKDLPFSQASNAEQIRVSMALGMASNPKLRVLRITDGSLLDDDSLQLVGEAAAQHDFQVWIERVETGGKVSVIMEDGEASGEDVVEEAKK